VLIITLCTIACDALSLAPLTGVLISEIFPNRVRGLGVSASVSALWIASFILMFTSPILNRRLGSSGTFWTYGVICLAGFLFVLARVPETKGKTLEELERALVR
jgi:MFS transporter, SP family, xylose:H+ symportor